MSLAGAPRPLIGFNYLGRFGGHADDDSSFAAQGRLSGAADPRMPLAHSLEVNAFAVDGEKGPAMTATWSWAPRLFERAEVEHIALDWTAALAALATRGAHIAGTEPTAARTSMVQLSRDQLERLEAEAVGIEDELNDEWEITT